MKKIISLFKRDYEGNRQVYDEVVPGAEWVINGEGVATVKYDGTCVMVQDGKEYKRYDRKLTKSATKRKRRDKSFVPTKEHFKPAPDGWIAAESEPNIHTGHWPGWLPINFDAPENRWHKEGFLNTHVGDGTYELVGPKVQGNPYGLESHQLFPHDNRLWSEGDVLRSFEDIKSWLEIMCYIEGIVWHHPDGRMVKIKRRDFGFDWPVKRPNTAN